MQVDRRARRVKTNNIGITKLLRSLMAHLRREPKVWSVVRVPTVAEEDDRRLHRERDRLINERVQHVNRIKGYALSTASTITSLFDRQMKRLEQLRTGDERELRPRCHIKAEIQGVQRLLLMPQMTAQRCQARGYHCQECEAALSFDSGRTCGVRCKALKLELKRRQKTLTQQSSYKPF